MDKKRLGNLGEKIAEKYLLDKGYQILDKNYSSHFISGPKRGEIDIIAKKGEVISFVEVKTGVRPVSDPEIPPEMKVNFEKQRKIIKMAESWLIEKKIPLDKGWQIDIISVRINLENKKAKILHFKNV